jgi:hypothetical protein
VLSATGFGIARQATVVVERFVDVWRKLLTRTDLPLGCAVPAVAVGKAGRQHRCGWAVSPSTAGPAHQGSGCVSTFRMVAA